jgi:hypothetical protein
MLAWGSCGRKGRKIVQEGCFGRDFKTGKPSSITLNVGAPTFLAFKAFPLLPGNIPRQPDYPSA